MVMLYGVVVPCNKGCGHLVAANKDYFEAWAQAYPHGGMPGAHTIRVGANAKVVRELRAKELNMTEIKLSEVSSINIHKGKGGLRLIVDEGQRVEVFLTTSQVKQLIRDLEYNLRL